MSGFLIIILLIIITLLYKIISKQTFIGNKTETNFGGLSDNYDYSRLNSTGYINLDDAEIVPVKLRVEGGQGATYIEDYLIDEGDSKEFLNKASVTYKDRDRGAAGGPSARHQSQRADQ